jgi:hypothetical protein
MLPRRPEQKHLFGARRHFVTLKAAVATVPANRCGTCRKSGRDRVLSRSGPAQPRRFLEVRDRSVVLRYRTSGVADIRARARSSPCQATRAIAVHPRFDLASYAASRATADVALLDAPLPGIAVLAALAARRRVAAGETLTIAGFGVTLAGAARGLGVPRMAKLSVTGEPGSMQIRLVDFATRNVSAGLGGCTGDCGAPAFDGDGPLVTGIVNWSSAPQDEEGCGGLTGVTPLLHYREWIIETAKKFNSPLGP